MKIIICGGGQVGRSIAMQLASEDNNITVIDVSVDLIHDITESLEVKGVVGFASYPGILEEAGAAEADMVIAVTFSDEVNMVICQVAHTLFKVPFKIARIRHQQYLSPLWKELYQHDHLPIDVIISPEIEIARVIHERLHITGVSDIIPFAEGKIQVLAVRCTTDSPLRNVSLLKIQHELLAYNASLIGLRREDEFFIPSAEDQLLCNDEIYFVVEQLHLKNVMPLFGYEDKITQKVIIVGGGNIGLFLAEKLEKNDPTIQLKILEVQKERAEFIAQALQHTTVIHGNALDQTILEEAGVANADVIIAVSNDDKVNILSSLLAKRFGCPKAVTLLNNTASYGPLVASLGVDVIISPRDSTVSSILQHVRMGKIRSVRAICGGTIEMMEAEALEASPVIGSRIGDLKLEEDIVLVAIMRNLHMILPEDSTIIEVGDRIIVLCPAAKVKKVEKIFAVKFEYF